LDVTGKRFSYCIYIFNIGVLGTHCSQGRTADCQFDERLIFLLDCTDRIESVDVRNKIKILLP